MFGRSKTPLKVLIKTLKEVKGALFIQSVAYLPLSNKLAIAYGCGSPGLKVKLPFAGISVFSYDLEGVEWDLADPKFVEVETSLGIKNIPALAGRIFKEIVNDLSSNLEENVHKIITPPSGSFFELISDEVVVPFKIGNDPKIRVSLKINGESFREEIPGMDVLGLGTRNLFNSMLGDYIDYLSSNTFVEDGLEYIELHAAWDGFSEKFIQVLSDSGVLDVLTIGLDELKEMIDKNLEELLALSSKKKDKFGVLKVYFTGADSLLEADAPDEARLLKLSGFKKAQYAFALLREPNVLPALLIEWILNDVGDDLIKEIVEGEDLSVFFGKEKMLIDGLVADVSLESIIGKINPGLFSNLVDAEVDPELKEFKAKAYLAVEKLKPKKKRKKKESLEKASKINVLTNFVKSKMGFSAPEEGGALEGDDWEKQSGKPRMLFPVFDSAERELRTRDFSKEIAVRYIYQNEDDIDMDKVKNIGKEVLSSIRNLFKLDLIWVTKGWAFYKPHKDDLLKTDKDKIIYNLINQWHEYRDSQYLKRWGFGNSYEKVFKGDVLRSLKRKGLVKEARDIDSYFASGSLILRNTGYGICTYKSVNLEDVGEAEDSVLMAVEEMRKEMIVPPNKVKASINLFAFRLKMKMNGMAVINADLPRVLDYMYDIAYLLKSRENLQSPQKIDIENMRKMLVELENEKFLRRGFCNGFPVTSVKVKEFGELSKEKILILQMINILSIRYDF